MTLVDDRRRIHLEPRRFAHSLALRYVKTKLTVERGV